MGVLEVCCLAVVCLAPVLGYYLSCKWDREIDCAYRELDAAKARVEDLRRRVRERA